MGSPRGTDGDAMRNPWGTHHGDVMRKPWGCHGDAMGNSLGTHGCVIEDPWGCRGDAREIRGELMWTSWATYGQISIAFLTAHCCVLAAFFERKHKYQRRTYVETGLRRIDSAMFHAVICYLSFYEKRKHKYQRRNSVETGLRIFKTRVPKLMRLHTYHSSTEGSNCDLESSCGL